MPRILHALNYAWPFINGYTVRSMGLITAQRRCLGFDARCVTAPFGPFPGARDPAVADADWGPSIQFGADAAPAGPLAWERPAIGLAPRAMQRMRHHLAQVLDTWRPDIIHAHHPWYVGAVAVDMARRYGIPVVYEVRCFNGDYDLDKTVPSWARAYVRARGHLQNQLEYRVCRRADTLVTISDGLAERIHRHSGRPESDVFVVRNSVDHARFHPLAERSETPGEVHLGYATTFAEMEGLDILVDAVALTRDRLPAHGPRLRVTLAGNGEDWGRIRERVARLGLQEVIDMPGALPYSAMPDFYRGLDGFIVPRRRSALAEHTTPLKPLEALASGVPVLASDVPALRELLGDRPGVAFFTPEPAALANALIDAVAAPLARPTNAVADRAWQDEVRRYEAVYAHARHESAHD